MECRPAVCSELAQHQVNVAHIDHGGTRLSFAVIVLAVAPRATMPGVGTFHHPAFLQRSEAFGPFRTRLHLDSPGWAMFCHPRLEHMIVVLVIGKDRFETGKVGSDSFSSFLQKHG